jgi:hypothetical protein
VRFTSEFRCNPKHMFMFKNLELLDDDKWCSETRM